MQVGVVREIKDNENRVSLVPAGVRALVDAGQTVLVQDGAGTGSGIDNAAYEAAGAVIVSDAAAVHRRADLILKVKEPQPREIPMLRKGQVIFTYLHLAPDRALTKGLLDTGVTAIAYETIVDREGGLPLLTPMSEVAEGWRSGPPTVARWEGAASCRAACRACAGDVVIWERHGRRQRRRHGARLGARVTIIDRSLPPLLPRGSTAASGDGLFGRRLHRRIGAAGRPVIGAVLIWRWPAAVTRAMVAPKGSVIVDVAVDRATAWVTRPTTPRTDLRSTA
jgi:alanine dehydrogenase